MLARRSQELLERYRRGEPAANTCLLEQGLTGQSPIRGDHQ